MLGGTYQGKIKAPRVNDASDIPICFIQGEGDWIAPTDMIAEFYSSITAPNKKLAIIENAGHTPFLDEPERFCVEVEGFLSECGIG